MAANLIPLPGVNNIVAELNGSILTLTIDIGKTGGESKSGKSVTVASSSGNKQILRTGAMLGLNVYLAQGNQAKLPTLQGSQDVTPNGVKNVVMRLEPGKSSTLLKIDVDLTQQFGESSSGKTNIVATTSGNKAVGSTGVMVGLNMYCKDKVTIPSNLEEAMQQVPGSVENILVECSKDHKEVVFKMDLTQCLRESGSGKTQIVASSNGHIKIDKTGFSYSMLLSAKSVPMNSPDTPERDFKGVENLKMSLENNQLILRVDLTKSKGISGSGKSTVITSTGKIKEVPDLEGLYLSLVVYQVLEEKKGKKAKKEMKEEEEEEVKKEGESGSDEEGKPKKKKAK